MPSESAAPERPDTGVMPPDPLARPHRLHFLTPIFLLIKSARQFIFLLAIAALNRWRGVLVPLALGGIAWTVLEWWRRTWVLDGDVLRIEEGVIGRKQRVVPVDRIQQVDVRRRLTHRLLGVASLRVETGGGSGGSEVELDALSVAQASMLRETLLARRGEGRGAGTAEGADAADAAARPRAAAPAPAEREVVKLTLAQAILAGVTSARAAAALAVIGPVLQYSDDLHIDVIGWVIDRIRPEQVLEVGALGIVTAVLSTIVVWFVLAAGTGILIDYGFSMTVKGGDLVVRRGLLERREIAIPLHRVQVVRIGESWVRRLLGMGTIQVFSGGSAGHERVADRVAIPILPMADAERVLRELLPDAVPLPALARPPRRARRRAIVQEILGLAPLGAIVGGQVWWLGVRFPEIGWALLVGALAAAVVAVPLGVAHWRSRGHAWERRLLFARTGILVRWTAIVPAAKAQSVRATSSPFQRRAGLASVHVDVAGAAPNPTVVDEAGARAGYLLGAVVAASRHRVAPPV